MSLRTYGMLCLAWCGLGCQARIDSSGVDAGVGAGGSPSAGGALSSGGGDSTLSGGTSAVTARPCDVNVDACEPVTLVPNLMDRPCALALDDTYVYWADCTTSKLMRVPIEGGSPTTLVTGEGAIARIAVDTRTSTG
jgi:hypothetical protein